MIPASPPRAPLFVKSPFASVGPPAQEEVGLDRSAASRPRASRRGRTRRSARRGARRRGPRRRSPARRSRRWPLGGAVLPRREARPRAVLPLMRWHGRHAGRRRASGCCAREAAIDPGEQERAQRAGQYEGQELPAARQDRSDKQRSAGKRITLNAASTGDAPDRGRRRGGQTSARSATAAMVNQAPPPMANRDFQVASRAMTITASRRIGPPARRCAPSALPPAGRTGQQDADRYRNHHPLEHGDGVRAASRRKAK